MRFQKNLFNCYIAINLRHASVNNASMPCFIVTFNVVSNYLFKESHTETI